MPIPWAGQEYQTWATEKVIKPILKGLDENNSMFVGFLYPGLKMTTTGPKVLEYNARFGDPETQVYMRLLETDLVEIIEACLDGKLSEVRTVWNKGFAVCVIIASYGYPVSRGEDVPISGIEKVEKIPGVVVFHPGTRLINNVVLAAGGRVLGVTAIGKTLQEAINNSYKAVGCIKFDGMQYRTDIGAKALIRLSKMSKLV